jgi:hypothetical protein
MNIAFTGIQFAIAIFVAIGMGYGALKVLVPAIVLDTVRPEIKRLETDLTKLDSVARSLRETDIKLLRDDLKYIRDQVDILRGKGN